MRIERLAAALLFALPLPAQAICTSFGVTTTTLDFGVYDPGSSSPTASTGNVTIRCGVGILPAFSVALSVGNGSYTQRTLRNGTDALDYNLYADAAHMTVWGDGTGATVTQDLTGLITLGSTSYTVYGAVAPGQHPAPGSYVDTITVIVNF
jgi:spore coat protein U-like protein